MIDPTDLFIDHTLKEHHTTNRDETRAYYLYRAGTTLNAASIVVHQSIIHVSSPDFGSLTLTPYAPDPLAWLRANHDRPRVLGYAIAENQRDSFLVMTAGGHEDVLQLAAHAGRSGDIVDVDQAFTACCARGEVTVSDYLALWAAHSAWSPPLTKVRIAAVPGRPAWVFFAALNRLVELMLERHGVVRWSVFEPEELTYP